MTAKPTGEEHIYLIGHLALKDYLEFMTTEPIDAASLDVKTLAEEWRAAHDHLRGLQQEEAAWADGVAVQPVPDGQQPLVARVLDDPIFQRSFSAVPVDIGLVELDRLVVYQKTIHAAHVKRIQAQLGPNPEAVFQLCMPFDHPSISYRVGRVSKNSYVFVSDSNDLRFLESAVFRPEQIRDFQSYGPVAGLVALVVGYGSNYLNVIACEGRLVLNNGFHRSYALRELGVTHAPCVIQKVTRREELSMVGGNALRRSPDLYLRAPRPPVLKDYFNSDLCRQVRLTPQARHVRVSFAVEEVDMPRE